MIRTLTSLITLILFSNFALAQTIPNGNFEEWEFDFAIESDKIDGWRANYDYFNEDQPVEKSDDAYEGDASALVKCPTFGDSGIVAVIPFVEFDNDALIGYYKAEIDKGDSAAILVQYFDGKNNVKQESAFYVKGSTSEWTFFQLKLNKANSSDSIRFVIYPSLDEGPRSNSRIWVDDFSLSTFVGKFNIAKNDFAVYPVPTTSELFVEVKENRSTIELISITGQVVFTCSNIAAHKRFAIDTTPFENGMYLLRITNEKGSLVKTVTFK